MTADADAAWDALSAGLQESAPLCAGRAVFTAQQLTAEQRAACSSICARCPVADLCDAYATAAKVEGGFWAGHYYTSKGRK